MPRKMLFVKYIATSEAAAPALPPPSKDRYIAISKERLVIIRAHPEKLNMAKVCSNHHLCEYQKMAYSKKDPSRVTLYHRQMSSTGLPLLVPRVFRVDDMETFKQTLTTNVSKLG